MPLRDLRAFRDALTLAWPLARKELAARYRGSLLGLAWTLLTPLMMVALYALVFTGVFQARWPGAVQADPLTYALQLFAGLMLYSSTSEAVARATRLIQDNSALVKRVVFPLEQLGVALVLQSAVHLLLQSGLIALLLLATGTGPRLGWLGLPLVWAWMLALQLGLVWAVGALACYVRDLQQLIPTLMGGLLFVSPVFYPVESAPTVLRGLLLINPLTAPIELARACWFGQAVDGALLWAPALIGLLSLGLGWLLFQRLRSGFADLV